MKPELTKAYIDVWALADLRATGTQPNHPNPYSVLWYSEIYYSLEDAQRAQTFLALRESTKYKIFHLEFPI